MGHRQLDEIRRVAKGISRDKSLSEEIKNAATYIYILAQKHQIEYEDALAKLTKYQNNYGNKISDDYDRYVDRD